MGWQKLRSGAVAAALLTAVAWLGGGGGVQAHEVRAGPVTSAAYPSSSGLVLFERGGNFFTVRPNGTSVRRVTSGGGYSGGQWSPDGTKVAYSRNGDIYVMSATGSSPRRVTTHAAPELWPTWSPDGRWLAFQSDRRNGLRDIYKLRSTRPYGNAVRLTVSGPDPASDWVEYLRPRWNPSVPRLSLVAYYGYEYYPGTLLLTIIDPATGAVLPGPSSVFALGHDWSPRGTKIVYENTANSDVGLPSWISRVNLDGTARVDVTPPDDCSVTCYGSDSDPVWSPDGTTIAYQAAGATGPEMWLAKPDGSAHQKLLSRATPLDWKR
jgi:Tol biopolymer transport system component